MDYANKQKNVVRIHELKSLINGSLNDIGRFDEILREIGEECFCAGYNQCKQNVYNCLAKSAIEDK